MKCCTNYNTDRSDSFQSEWGCHDVRSRVVNWMLNWTLDWSLNLSLKLRLLWRCLMWLNGFMRKSVIEETWTVPRKVVLYILMRPRAELVTCLNSDMKVRIDSGVKSFLCHQVQRRYLCSYVTPIQHFSDSSSVIVISSPLPPLLKP